MLRRILFGALLTWGALSIGSFLPGRAEAQRSHTVRAGQSLSRIARRYHVDVWDLAMANRMRPTSTLRPGQSLTVPPRGVTYVRAGQTLSHVARDHHCSVEELQRLNRLRRRGLRVGQRLILPTYVAEEEARDRDWGPPPTPGAVRVRRRDEVRPLTLVDAEGRVTQEALVGLGEAMRRHDDDPAELPHPRLALLLASISDHFGGREIVLVSGRREAGGYTRESSRHTLGQATDVRIVGVPQRALWDYCRSLARTGCGYYPRSTFVHVDVRARAGQWVDWSRPGARPSYGNLRGPFPRFCRARSRRSHPRCARESRRVTREDAVALEPVLSDEARRLMPAVPSLDQDEAHDEADELELEGEAAAEAEADGALDA